MKLFLLGIGGVGMGNLASLLKQAGHDVSGCDDAVYPPMSDFLEEQGIAYATGYKPENLSSDIDIVIVGNVISADNPMVPAIQQRGLEVLSMPQAIQRLCLPEREAIVVAGTHGKTTTTSLMTHALMVAGKEPGYFIGGIAKDFGRGAALGKPPYFVLEGDEYDSAYFQKEPKFLSYQPKYLILTSIEFDHSDIYTDIEEISKEFEKLMAIMPKQGVVLVHSQAKLAMEIARKANCTVYTFGDRAEDDFRIQNVRQTEAQHHVEFSIVSKTGPKDGTSTIDITFPMFGNHNIANATAVASLCTVLNIEPEAIQKALASFQGVERRQQLVYRGEATATNNELVVIDDFAHHPTAVRETLEGMRACYPDYKLYAVFEPRSNTSTKNFMQAELAQALSIADVSIVYKLHRAERIPEDLRLDRRWLQEHLKQQGREAHLFNDVDGILEYLRQSRDHASKQVIVVMSNGHFDGLRQRLAEIYS